MVSMSLDTRIFLSVQSKKVYVRNKKMQALHQCENLRIYKNVVLLSESFNDICKKIKKL